MKTSIFMAIMSHLSDCQELIKVNPDEITKRLNFVKKLLITYGGDLEQEIESTKLDEILTNMDRKKFSVRLKGELDLDLLKLGFKAGDVIENCSKPDPVNGGVNWDFFYIITNHCVVYPGNYEIIDE